MKIPPSRQMQSKFIPLGFILLVTLTVIVAALSFSQTGVVRASGSDMNQVENKYPKIIGSNIDQCELCHTSSIPALNAYGAAYKAKGRSTSAFGLIEALDSDGDGFTNLQEINALTYPGDASDHPISTAPTATKVPTQAPTATKVPTQAPTATKIPTQAPTATKIPTQAPTATQVPTLAPTQTNVPPQAPTLAHTATKVSTQAPVVTKTPGQIGPKPTPTCQNKDNGKWWYRFFRHGNNCGKDDHRDNHGDDREDDHDD